MEKTSFTLWRLPAALFLAASAALPAFSQDIPDSLLEDSHFREEFGLNELTTPSIRKIFGELQQLGDIPYDELKRQPPEKLPPDRTLLALSLGSLIAEGFFVVHSEKLSDLENVGRALIKHADALGAGTRLTSHANALMEHSRDGDWDKLKEELAATQRDVEIEMIVLRDVDTVHLIGFGGWLRAFDVACATALKSFSPEKAEVLRRVDIAEYYVNEFETLEPKLQEKENIIAIRAGLAELLEIIAATEDQELTEEQVKVMREKVSALAAVAFPPSDSSGGEPTS